MTTGMTKTMLLVSVLLACLTVEAPLHAAETKGVPPIITKLVKSHYDADNGAGLLETFGATAKAFDAAWDAYGARRAEVQKAVNGAASLATAGKTDAAVAMLKTVITAVPRDEAGKLPTKRAVLEPRDAELDAVLAWARLAASSHDVYAIADLCAALYVRRKVSDDKLTEELLWFGDADGDQLKFMTSDDDDADEKRVRQAMSDALDLPQAGPALAMGFFRGAAAGLGVRHGAYEDISKGKQGEWVIFDLAPDAIDDKKIAFSESVSWSEPYDCRVTDKIDSIDPVSGKVTYVEQCKYREIKKHYELTASLAVAPAAWMKAKGTTVAVLGRVDRVGPKWTLSKAAVLDLRFLYSATGDADSNTPPTLDLGAGDE